MTSIVYKIKPLSRKKAIYGSHSPFMLPVFPLELQQWPLVWLLPPRPESKAHTEATHVYSTVKWVTCISVTENSFHSWLFIPLCFVLMNTLHYLSDGRATCLNLLPSSVAAGDFVAAPHESEQDFQITFNVCFTQLAKPDVWSSTQAMNTRKFRQSLVGKQYSTLFSYWKLTRHHLSCLCAVNVIC